MRQDIEFRAEGNDACQQLMDHWAQEVRKGEINYCAIVLSTAPTQYITGQAGVIGHDFAMLAGLEAMRDKIKWQVKNRMPNAPDPSLGADYAMYNLVRMSCSFDFLTWIVNAEMIRIRAGAPAPLKVGFFVGKETNFEEALGGEQRKTNYENIMKPLMAMMGAVEDERAISGPPLDSLSLVPVVKAYNEGEKLPKIVIPDEAKEEMRQAIMEACGKIPVTITLREATHFENRNSNIPEWLKFADWLIARGEKVLFIRDTAKAMEPLEGYNTCPPASQNLYARMALYSIAKANLFVSNGPAMLAVMFTEKPWLFVNQLRIDDKYAPNTPDGWAYFTGINNGAQWPWAREDQRVIYEPDTFENIKDAWLEHIEPKLKEAA